MSVFGILILLDKIKSTSIEVLFFILLFKHRFHKLSQIVSFYVFKLDLENNLKSVLICVNLKSILLLVSNIVSCQAMLHQYNHGL